jgi:hypothetical protein
MEVSMLPTQFKSQGDLMSYLSTLEKRVNSLENENRSLKEVINDMSHESAELSRNSNLDLPSTNLLSNNFIARAFAVWGHYFVAQLIISVIVGGCIMVFYFASIMTLLSNLRQSIP